MLIVDVNVLVNANRDQAPSHAQYKQWLEGALVGTETLGVSELVLSAFVRIMTNYRVADPPLTPEDAIEFCEVVRTSASTTVIKPGSRHWSIFCELVRATQARSNAVPDAYLAALALENGATFVTSDRGFRRFPGLRTLDPLAALG